MDKRNITPQQTQPINRSSTSQLPSELAELSEAILQDGTLNLSGLAPSMSCPRTIMCHMMGGEICAFDGDDAE